MADSAPLGAIEAALAEAERVVKRQKTCAARTSGALFKVIHSIEAAIKTLAEDPNIDAAATVAELTATIAAADPTAQVASDTKELHGAVGRLGKVVEKEFSGDVCGALRHVGLDRPTLDRIIAQHLYHQGDFGVADAFVAEAKIEDAAALKAPYVAMHAVLEQMDRGDLKPALEWAEAHKHELRRRETAGSGGNVDLEPSSLEFSLHRLAFLQLLDREGQGAAMAYARAVFPPFAAGSKGRQVQRLMGVLCYKKRAKPRSEGPYADLLGPQLWADAASEFHRWCCVLLGQAEHSPLLVTVSAGAAALPTLLKLAAVVAKTQPSADLAGSSGELPVEVPLGREFVFHSIFACPVSREQSSEENPPMMLPCGHCMGKQSVLRVAKSLTRAFKCPYCPVEATLQQCMQLHLPDMK